MRGRVLNLCLGEGTFLACAFELAHGAVVPNRRASHAVCALRIAPCLRLSDRNSPPFPPLDSPLAPQNSAKHERVSKIIQELGLKKVENTYIGNAFVRGVSGGERKRVNIGVELVTDPSLIFLDEVCVVASRARGRVRTSVWLSQGRRALAM